MTIAQGETYYKRRSTEGEEKGFDDERNGQQSRADGHYKWFFRPGFRVYGNSLN